MKVKTRQDVSQEKKRTSVKMSLLTLSKYTVRVGVCTGKCISSSIWTSDWVNHDTYDRLDSFSLNKNNNF